MKSFVLKNWASKSVYVLDTGSDFELAILGQPSKFWDYCHMPAILFLIFWFYHHKNPFFVYYMCSVKYQYHKVYVNFTCICICIVYANFWWKVCSQKLGGHYCQILWHSDEWEFWKISLFSPWKFPIFLKVIHTHISRCKARK